MSTLIIADLLDSLVAVIDDARIAAASNSRWLNAIDAGYDWLLRQDVIEFDADRHELTYTSDSGETYHANGSCQCQAFAKHNACKHRAAARLIRRALERQERCEARDKASDLGRRISTARAKAYREVAELFA